MQRRTMVRTTVTTVAAAVLGTGVLVTAPGATAAPREEHCVVRVLGQRPTGELETTAPTCAPTRDQALARSGATADADVPIGYHYDGVDLTGSSFTVVGSSCVGGWLNLPATWVNRVSSTLHGCPHIRHFDGNNLTGASQMTVYPGGNLAAAMNNKTNSIQYLP